MHKQALADSSKRKTTVNQVDIENVLTSTYQHVATNRNIEVPSLLQTYCNLMEFLRLRNEIIIAASECNVLRAVYAY